MKQTTYFSCNYMIKCFLKAHDLGTSLKSEFSGFLKSDNRIEIYVCKIHLSNASLHRQNLLDLNYPQQVRLRILIDS